MLIIETLYLRFTKQAAAVRRNGLPFDSRTYFEGGNVFVSRGPIEVGWLANEAFAQSKQEVIGHLLGSNRVDGLSVRSHLCPHSLVITLRTKVTHHRDAEWGP